MDADSILEGLPPGSYVLTEHKGKLVPILVYLDEPEWVPGEIPFGLVEERRAA